VLTEHVGLDRRRRYIQPPSDVMPKPQAVNVCPAAQHAPEPCGAHKISKRIRWIRKDEDQRVRGYSRESRQDVPVHADVRFEQLEPACRIAPVDGAAAFLIDPGADDHQLRAGEIRIISVANIDDGRQRRAVTKIHRDGTSSFAVSIENHDFAYRAANDQREQTRRTDSS